MGTRVGVTHLLKGMMHAYFVLTVRGRDSLQREEKVENRKKWIESKGKLTFDMSFLPFSSASLCVSSSSKGMRWEGKQEEGNFSLSQKSVGWKHVGKKEMIAVESVTREREIQKASSSRKRWRGKKDDDHQAMMMMTKRRRRGGCVWRRVRGTCFMKKMKEEREVTHLDLHSLQSADEGKKWETVWWWWSSWLLPVFLFPSFLRQQNVVKSD